MMRLWRTSRDKKNGECSRERKREQLDRREEIIQEKEEQENAKEIGRRNRESASERKRVRERERESKGKKSGEMLKR